MVTPEKSTLIQVASKLTVPSPYHKVCRICDDSLRYNQGPPPRDTVMHRSLISVIAASCTAHIEQDTNIVYVAIAARNEGSDFVQKASGHTDCLAELQMHPSQ